MFSHHPDQSATQIADRHPQLLSFPPLSLIVAWKVYIILYVVFVCIVTDEKARNGERGSHGEAPREGTHYTEYSVWATTGFSQK